MLGAREQLRNTEQNTLLSGVTAYMDVLRDTALLELQRNNVLVLREQLRETRDRFTVGEVTRTDVAQAEASLSSSQATELSAEATLEASIARYRQTIGDEPKMLAPAKPLARPLPKTLPEAITISQVEHPAITAQLHGVDAALLSVKIAEGALAPSVGVTASITKNYDVNLIPGNWEMVAQIEGQVTIPIYQGGAEYASIRQSKESLSVQELTADFDARPDPAERGHRLGPQSGFDWRGARCESCGRGERSRPRRRARGGQGRSAHDARRPQRPTGPAERQKPVGFGRARRGRRIPIRCSRPSAA